MKLLDDITGLYSRMKNKFVKKKQTLQSKKLLEQKKKEFMERFDLEKHKQKLRDSPHYEKNQMKLKSLVHNHYDREIEKRIDNNSPDVDTRFSVIKMTRTAYEKGKYIARKMQDIFRQSLEVSMAMAAKKDSLLVDDLYVMHDQYVTPAHCIETSIGKIKTKKEMEANLEERIGWAHTHGSFPLFFSGEDYEHLYKDAWQGRKIKLDLLDDEPGEDKMEVPVNIYSALVFNDSMTENQNPHTGIAISYKTFSDNKRKLVFNEDVSFHIVADEYTSFDEAQIDRQLEERVSLEDAYRNIHRTL